MDEQTGFPLSKRLHNKCPVALGMVSLKAQERDAFAI